MTIDKEKSDAQKKINEIGGWVYAGLYHGSRRVKAKLSSTYSSGYPTGDWIIHPSEIDLIKASGTARISYGFHPYDLQLVNPHLGVRV